MAVLSPNEILGRLFEPVVKNRFVFYVEGIPTFLIKSTTLPTFDDGEIVVNHINTQRKFRSGRRTWGDVTIKFHSAVSPNAQQSIYDWMMLAHEDVSGRSGYADYYKKDCTINILSGPGEVISEWILKGAFIKSGDFDGMDYDAASEYAQPTLVLAYDYGILNF